MSRNLRPVLSSAFGFAIVGLGLWVGVEEVGEGFSLGAHHGLVALGALVAVRGAAELAERLSELESGVAARLTLTLSHPLPDLAVGALLIASAIAELARPAADGGTTLLAYSHLGVLLLGGLALARAYSALFQASHHLRGVRPLSLLEHAAANRLVGGFLIVAALADWVGSNAGVGLHHALMPAGLFHLLRSAPGFQTAAELAGAAARPSD